MHFVTSAETNDGDDLSAQSFVGRGKILAVEVIDDVRKRSKGRCLRVDCALENKSSSTNMGHYSYYASEDDFWRIETEKVLKYCGKDMFDAYKANGKKWPAGNKLLKWLESTGISSGFLFFFVIFRAVMVGFWQLMRLLPDTMMKVGI